MLTLTLLRRGFSLLPESHDPPSRDAGDLGFWVGGWVLGECIWNILGKVVGWGFRA